MLIYFAGSPFSEAERRFNLELTGRLEDLCFRVLLPQRDGVEREKPPYKAMTPEERRRATFDLVNAQILDSDVFLFVPDGRVPEEGVCVELGIAYCQKDLQTCEKLLIGLHTDSPSAFLGSRLDPMVLVPLGVPLGCVVGDEERLLRVLVEHRAMANWGTK